MSTPSVSEPLKVVVLVPRTIRPINFTSGGCVAEDPRTLG